MLYQLIDKLNAQINKMDVKAEAPLFVEQWRKMRPSLENELKSHGVPPDQFANVMLTLSMAQLGYIKCIPTWATEMCQVLQSGSGDPSFRCVLASSLAYLVQPLDLLPDNLPGGYGFIDDVLLLTEARAISWDISGNSKNAEEIRKVFQFIFVFVPDNRQEEFKNAINGMATVMNLFSSLDPMVAEMTTQMLIQNPLQPVTSGEQGQPSAFGSKFSSYASAPKYQYTWKDGNNMGVNFSGGGGVATDGRDVFIL
jgi:uncharacterized membrane protein YkvA (DUF1232 family)